MEMKDDAVKKSIARRVVVVGANWHDISQAGNTPLLGTEIAATKRDTFVTGYAEEAAG